MVYISFPISGVLRFVPQSSAGKGSDHFLRLSKWFRLIVENRPNYSEDVTELTDINDIRNGVLASVMVHRGFDPRLAAVLKVCQICPPSSPLSDPLCRHQSSDSKPYS